MEILIIVSNKIVSFLSTSFHFIFLLTGPPRLAIAILPASLL